MSGSRSPSTHRHTIAGLAVALAAASVWWGAGCDRLSDRPRSAGKVELPALETPMAVARALSTWHMERRYGLLEQFVQPDQRRVLEDTLMAFDRVLQANDRAQHRLIDMHNESVAGEFDLGNIADNMGLFSRNVNFRSERIDGDKAVVIVQVLDRVPLEQYRFVRRQDRWIYTPDAPISDMHTLINELAKGVEEFEYQLENRDLSIEQVRSEFRYRVWPRMRDIRSAMSTPRPTTTSQPTTTSGPTTMSGPTTTSGPTTAPGPTTSTSNRASQPSLPRKRATPSER